MNDIYKTPIYLRRRWNVSHFNVNLGNIDWVLTVDVLLWLTDVFLLIL